MFRFCPDPTRPGPTRLDSAQPGLKHVVENDSDTELLQLSYAGIGNAGSKALAAGLVLNNYIHTINIAGNGIGARGAKALGKGKLDIELYWILLHHFTPDTLRIRHQTTHLS